MPLTFRTAGESHGKALLALVEGVPAGLPISADAVDKDLGRRMQGHGRGARMKIEQDRIEWISGVRAGETIGSPIAMLIHNRDWANWEEVMSAEGTPGELRRRRVTRPRPGHADLVGVLKYDRVDARDILERASARETAARVAAGAVARRLLAEFGIDIGSHLVSLGGIRATVPALLPTPLNYASDASPVRTLDPVAGAAMIARIDQAKQDGDTLGGEIEVVAQGLPVGLGSHVSWDRKLDGRLAGILMSIPAVKGVEIGLGFEAARRPGSAVHDPIVATIPTPNDAHGSSILVGATHASPQHKPAPGAHEPDVVRAVDASPQHKPAPGAHEPDVVRAVDASPQPNRHDEPMGASTDPRAGFRRVGNNAGGLEGGMTTGEPLVVRVAMKPISTLMSPLKTVNLATGGEANAVSERSDVTAVPAMGVIAEALVAIVLADAMIEKFGGDSLAEMRRNHASYLASAGARWAALRDAPAPEEER
ncbi:MAG: chorismate synthase [Gemmatimonadales bacterium]|nr:chorismate synthase [Gemmatimonadales bacterium]MBP6569926.1 chorismate synthase [Gemmatimonadales bacterium]MBP7620389.1 chorismate synthase [Gemmatimonadales bacterium]